MTPLSHARVTFVSKRAVTVPLVAVFAGACGPHAHIPPRPTPTTVIFAGAPDSTAALARALAPLLLEQPDETFPLSRAVAVVHPTRRVIAYHLLWRDDVHGAWIPFTIATDEEVVWVGYDSTLAPTDLWTYWHGTILHTPWTGRQPMIDVQWGKHGSLPHGIRQGDLPRTRSLNLFYTFTFAFPDLALGAINRKGPLCFCHGYRRYRDFSRPLVLADHLDAVVVAREPKPALQQIFGRRYSEKPRWPWRVDLSEVKGKT